MPVQERGDFGSGGLFSRGGEIDHVGKHDRHRSLRRDEIAASKEMAYQFLRHVGLEPTQPGQHRIVGPRLLVQFGEQAAGQGVKSRKVEHADGTDLMRHAGNRANDQAADDPCNDNSCEQDHETGYAGAQQVPYRLFQGFDRYLDADDERAGA